MPSVIIFRARRAAALTNPNAADTVFLDNLVSTQAAFVKGPNPPIGAAGGFQFKVRAWGRATGGVALVTFQPKIYFGASTTIGSDNVTLAGVAATYGAASGNWGINGYYTWDPTSLQLNSFGEQWGGNTNQATLITGTAVTSLNLNVTDPSWLVSGIFSASNAGNICYLDGLELELVGVPDGI